MPKKKSDESLLKELIEKGYGKDEREARRKKQQYKLRARQNYQVRQRNADSGQPASSDLRGKKRSSGLKGPYDAKFRHRVDAYAYRNRFLITGFFEYLKTFINLIIPKLKDYPTEAFWQIMTKGSGFKDENPEEYCLLDNLDALNHTAGFFLGYHRPIVPGIEHEELDESIVNLQKLIYKVSNFTFDFFMHFHNRDEQVIQILRRLAADKNKKIEIVEFFPVIRYFYALLYKAGSFSKAQVERILGLIVEICRFGEMDDDILKEIEKQAALFRTAYNNLSFFRRELYPGLLKAVGIFLPLEESGDQRILKALKLSTDEIMDFKNYSENRQALVEPEPQPDEESEEIPKIFTPKFQSTLKVLKRIFPESGVDGLEDWNYILPFFDLMIFKTDLTFTNDVEYLSAADPMSQIMVFHRIIDQILSCFVLFGLDEIFDKSEKFEERLTRIRKDWTKVYISIFNIYVKIMRDYVKFIEEGLADDQNRTRYRNKLVEDHHLIMNQVIRKFAKVLLKGGGIRDSFPVKTYELARDLADVFQEMGRFISRDLIREKDPQAIEILKGLAKSNFINFEANKHKPVIKQIYQFIEEGLKSPLEEVPVKAQWVFFEFFTDLVAMYSYLLNSEESFYREAREINLAGDNEKAVWQNFKGLASLIASEM